MAQQQTADKNLQQKKDDTGHPTLVGVSPSVDVHAPEEDFQATTQTASSKFAPTDFRAVWGPHLDPELEEQLKTAKVSKTPDGGLFFKFANDQTLLWKGDSNGEFLGQHLEKDTTFTEESAHTIMLAAKSRGWDTIELHGTPEQKFMLWKEAQKMGLDVQGYNPTPSELANLGKPAGNEILDEQARLGINVDADTNKFSLNRNAGESYREWLYRTHRNAPVNDSNERLVKDALKKVMESAFEDQEFQSEFSNDLSHENKLALLRDFENRAGISVFPDSGEPSDTVQSNFTTLNNKTAAADAKTDPDATQKAAEQKSVAQPSVFQSALNKLDRSSHKPAQQKHSYAKKGRKASKNAAIKPSHNA